MLARRGKRREGCQAYALRTDKTRQANELELALRHSGCIQDYADPRRLEAIRMANDQICWRARGATPERDEDAPRYRTALVGRAFRQNKCAFQSLRNWPIGSKVTLITWPYTILFERTVRPQLTALLARYVVTSEIP